MKHVRIYPQSKSVTQSGHAGAGQWVIEPEQASARAPEQLMGWTSSGDTLSSLHMTFSSRVEAEMFAKSQGWLYTVSLPNQRKVKPRNYADNFRFEESKA